MDITKKAGLALGAVGGLATVVLGAPLWTGILVGAGLGLVTPKAIDFVATKKSA